MAKTGAGGADNLDGGGGDAADQTQTVHVNEEVIWKARAEEAEAQLEQLQGRVVELEAALASANETITQIERRGEIDRELTAAKAVDLETARLLTEVVIGEMDEPDVAMAVRELCESKPFLFACKKHSGYTGVSMSPQSANVERESLDAMARQARGSGNRSELLRYLRARRTV
jgi:TolA-binding protein